MSVRMYILIDTDVGMARAVAMGLSKIESPYSKIVSIDTVSGPNDLIILIESPDLDSAGILLTEHVQKVPNIRNTITCLAISVA